MKMNTNMEICQICGEGQLNATTRINHVVYKGQDKDLTIQGSVCNTCGSEQASAVQTRVNKRAMQAFKKEVDGLLTGADIKDLRQHFHITQAQAAKIFGGGPVAFSKYEADDVSQSEPMDKLLRVTLAVPNAFAWLSKEAGEMDAYMHTMSESLKRMQKVAAQNYRVDVTKATFNTPITLVDSFSTNGCWATESPLLEVA
jgi:HTH-type transcriptional regulator/antitoxin MqsA